MLTADRNCGKTTSCLNSIMKRVNHENKVLFIRNTEKQLKTFINDFNNRYKDKFIVRGGMVYQLKPYTKYNKLIADDEIFYKIGDNVGYVCDINNYQNYKSVEAKNIKYVLFDEAVEIDILPFFYEKFINVLTTFERFNFPSLVILANRDQPNNEFMVSWGIEPSINEPKEDIITEFEPGYFYVDLGTDQFKDLYEDNDTMFRKLAKYNVNTDNYIHKGGYLTEISMNVLNYNKKIKETFNPTSLVSWGERVAAMGYFGENQDKVVVCVSPHAVDKAKEENLLNIPLDAKGILVVDSVLINRSASDRILGALLYEYKQGNLYADSFELYTFLKDNIAVYGLFE